MTVVSAQSAGPRTPVVGVPASRALHACWAVGFGSLVVAFPLYTYLVFGAGADRGAMADALAVQATVAYFLGIFAAALPLPGLSGWSRYARLQAVVLPFVLCSYLTHLTWELGWLVLHRSIAGAHDSPWAYAWWAYIDGGDRRYLDPEPHFLMIEVLSVLNGCIGLAGLALLRRSRFADHRGTLLVMATAVTHTVLTWYYYGSEVIGGFPSVDTSSVLDLGVKFILLNAPWLIAPWLVLAWGLQTLRRQFAPASSPGPEAR